MLQQLERILSALNKTDLLSKEYSDLLTLYWTVYEINKKTADTTVTVSDAVEEPQEAEPTTKNDETLATTEQCSEAPSAPITEEITAEYARGLLSEVSRSGKVKVQDIVRKYIPEGAVARFSSIPKENYPEFVKELKTYAG